MDVPSLPLLPAFYLLWNAAKLESRKKVTEIDALNANRGAPGQQNFVNGTMDFYPCNENRFCHSSKNESNSGSKTGEKNKNRSEIDFNESVVVCTLECDHGDKFVKQVIHDGPTRTQWSRAEDLFVDWLNSELTSQHARRIDVTIYFCRVPMSTSSDGISLWLKNVRAEGKEVNIKIKVASLGATVSRALNDLSRVQRQHRGSLLEDYELHEVEDTVDALKKLVSMGAKIEPVSTGDWIQLITLLTDRVSLQALDLKNSPMATDLGKIIHVTP